MSVKWLSNAQRVRLGMSAAARLRGRKTPSVLPDPTTHQPSAPAEVTATVQEIGLLSLIRTSTSDRHADRISNSDSAPFLDPKNRRLSRQYTAFLGTTSG